MTDLLAAIRARTDDNRISQRDLQELVDLAAEDQVSADEVEQLVSAFDRVDEGFTAESRARLWARLRTLNATDALSALEQRPATGVRDRLEETQRRVEVVMKTLDQTREQVKVTAQALERAADPEALERGELRAAEGDAEGFEEMKADLEASQREALELTQTLRGLLDIPAAERQAMALSFGYGTRWNADDLAEPLEPRLAGWGLDEGQKTALDQPLESPMQTEGRVEDVTEFAGMQFAQPLTLEIRNGAVSLPEGTELTSMPDAGEFRIVGEQMQISSGLQVSGAVLIEGDSWKVDSDEALYVDGVPFELERRAEVSYARGTLLTEGARLNLAEAPETVTRPEESRHTGERTGERTVRTLRFALQDSELPDGTLLEQGSGLLEVVIEDGEVIGYRPGSIQITANSVIEHRADEEAIGLSGHRGNVGRLSQGGVLMRGDRVVGFAPYSKATLDGIELQTRNEKAAYRFTPPGTFELGKGARVTGAMDGREITVKGEGISVALGDETIVVREGGVVIRDGRAVGLTAGTKATFSGVQVATEGAMELLDEEPRSTRAPQGNALWLSSDGPHAWGRGVRLTPQVGSQVMDLDPGDRFAVELRGGHAAIAAGSSDLRPPHLEVTVDGNVTVESGRFDFNSADETATESGSEGVPGPMVLIHSGGTTYEIDNRPMWPQNGGELGPRVRQVPDIHHPDRFGTREARGVLAGRNTLQSGARGELVEHVQSTLGWFLNRSVSVDGAYGPKTAAAVEAFQRLNRLPVTGRVDAATLARMDAVAPERGAPREKVMVMVATNNDVPDELRRFRQLARERGAKPVIVGPPDGEYPELNDLEKLFQAAERGEIDFDWLVISGHSTGSSTWGKFGTLDYTDLERWSQQYPAAAAQIEKLQLQNCYNVTIERANGMWPDMFPNVSGLAGFMYSAPGKKAQSSDENLLHAGRLLNRVGKGEVASEALAERIGRGYTRDDYIKWQNASLWVRYADESGDDNGHFAMTAAAARELRRHGAADELSVTAFEQAQTFERYFDAQPGYEHPPEEHHSGPLREYLNAVDGVVGRWEGRLRRAEQYRERADRDPSFEIPEDYRFTSTWEGEVDELRELRARILYLIYFESMCELFGEHYGSTITAFNQLLERHGVSERFPRPDQLEGMTRAEVLAKLDSLREAVGELPDDVRTTEMEDPAWQIMVGTDPSETEATSPQGFIARATQFLERLDNELIAPEWL